MEAPRERKFDLEKRTLDFAKRVRALVKRLPNTIGNIEDSKQLVRSSGSVGANYIEANEALGAKDFAMHARIARKEAKESGHWLALLDSGGQPEVEKEITILLQEAREFVLMFSAMLRKSN